MADGKAMMLALLRCNFLKNVEDVYVIKWLSHMKILNQTVAKIKKKRINFEFVHIK